jgi:hypothetical protein
MRQLISDAIARLSMFVQGQQPAQINVADVEPPAAGGAPNAAAG